MREVQQGAAYIVASIIMVVLVFAGAFAYTSRAAGMGPDGARGLLGSGVGVGSLNYRIQVIITREGGARGRVGTDDGRIYCGDNCDYRTYASESNPPTMTLYSVTDVGAGLQWDGCTSIEGRNCNVTLKVWTAQADDEYDGAKVYLTITPPPAS